MTGSRSGGIVGAGPWRNAVAGASVADVADGTDEPVMRSRRIGDDETVGLGIPNRAVGAFPTVAGAGFAGVLSVEILSIDSNAVPHRGGGPTMMRTSLGVGVVAHAVDENVGTSGE